MISSSKVKVLAVFGVMLMVGSALCVLAVTDDSVAASPKTYTLELTDNASTSDAKAKDAFGKENASYSYDGSVGTLTLRNTAEFATTTDKAISCTVDVAIILEKDCNIKIASENDKYGSCGIYGDGNVTIKGNGSLTMDLSQNTSNKCIAISSGKDLTINGPTINTIVPCTYSQSYSISGDNVSIENAVIDDKDTEGDNYNEHCGIGANKSIKIKSSNITMTYKTNAYVINGIKGGIGVEIESSYFNCNIPTTKHGSSCIDAFGNNGLVIKDSKIDFLTGTSNYCYGIAVKSFSIDNSIVNIETKEHSSRYSSPISLTGTDYQINHSILTVKSGSNGRAFQINETASDMIFDNVTNCDGFYKSDGSKVDTTGSGKDKQYLTKQLTAFTIKTDICCIEYNFNGGTGSIQGVKIMNSGSTIFTPSAPSREGYVFLGWSDGTDTNGANSENGLYDAETEYTVSKSVTFKAVWEPMTKVNLPESGSESMSDNFLIRGTTTGKTVTVTVNGVQAGSADISPTGEFEIVVKLSEGDNVIVVYVDDGNGNTAVRATMVTYEKTDVNTGLLIAFAVSILFTLYIGIVIVRRT